jgi:soluble lytic murein transglycosylase-like protein
MSLLRLFQQCIVVIALILPVQVCGAIYVYVDEKGVKHYTNTPTGKRYKLATLRRLNTPPSNASYNKNKGYRRIPSGSNDSAQYDRQIEQAANAYLVDPLLIKAIIKAESDFNQFATSSKGAQGLMQLMPGTARDLRVADPYNAVQNINGGTRYFKKLLDVYKGDLARSLAAYNAGPGRVTKNGPLPRIKETRDYVQRVTRYYQLYQQAKSTGMSQKSKLRKLVTVN